MAKAKKKESLTPEERLQAALVPESEQPYKVPGNWCWVYAPSMFNIEYGKGLPTKKLCENGYPVFGANGQIGFYSEYMFEDEKALMSCRGAYSGTMNLSLPKSFITNNSLVIESKLADVSVEFVFYLYSALNKANLISGSAQPQVTVQAFNNYPVPISPLPEQQRIVNRIESLFAKLDEAKQKAQDALDSFETRKAAILHKAFTGELIGKHSIAITTLEEITTCIRIGPFGSALHKEDYILGGVPVVNPKHIVLQKIVPEEKTTVSVQKAEELSSYILKKNDIILGRRGDMGRSAPVTDLEAGWLCGTGSMIIRLKSGYNAKFYSQIIASQSAVRYLEENSVGSTMKNLNEKIVRLLPIPDFTVDEQLEIVRLLDDLLAKEQQAKEAAEGVLEQIDLMKKAILARAFRGELGTNDPREESAVELLKQVL